MAPYLKSHRQPVQDLLQHSFLPNSCPTLLLHPMVDHAAKHSLQIWDAEAPLASGTPGWIVGITDPQWHDWECAPQLQPCFSKGCLHLVLPFGSILRNGEVAFLSNPQKAFLRPLKIISGFQLKIRSPI